MTYHGSGRTDDNKRCTTGIRRVSVPGVVRCMDLLEGRTTHPILYNEMGTTDLGWTKRPVVPRGNQGEVMVEEEEEEEAGDNGRDNMQLLPLSPSVSTIPIPTTITSSPPLLPPPTPLPPPALTPSLHHHYYYH
ncbi:hypothetical protein Pmani_014461 [Petrolisthes manimaculis]|uniref:Uncharacterized protein n=1 Tax=Petrolisthes manimaculis TaxID=1843537 RepID=A0AAE1PW35_9EUCA|nr:hypothetical protein Pmani_014461 [Petrolisthes manimaculis]